MKSFVVFRFNENVTADMIKEAVDSNELKFHDFQTPTQTIADGFCDVAKNFKFVERVNDKLLEIRFKTRKKNIPTSVIKEKIEEFIEDTVQQTGVKPTKKEIRDYKEELLKLLLPNAYPKKTEVGIYFDFNNHCVFCETTSPDNAAEILSNITRYLMEHKNIENGLEITNIQYPKPFCSTMKELLLNQHFQSDENTASKADSLLPNGNYVISGEGQTGKNLKNSKISLKNIADNSKELLQALNGSNTRFVSSIGFDYCEGSFIVNEALVFSSITLNDEPKFKPSEQSQEDFLTTRLVVYINEMNAMVEALSKLLS